MGMNAIVLAIGPYYILEKWDVLEYPKSFYEEVAINATVLGTVAGCDTSDQSHRLAAICGVEPWDLGNHRIHNPQRPDIWDEEELIGTEEPTVIYERIVGLLSCGVELWYQPNG